MNALLLLFCTQALAYSPGAVISNFPNERIQRATIAGGNPPSVIRQGGSWLTYSSRSAAGNYHFTMTGFSSTPACIVTIGQSLRANVAVDTTSSTALQTQTFSYPGYSGADADFNIICMGVK
jgi:hypothetical protein